MALEMILNSGEQRISVRLSPLMSQTREENAGWRRCTAPGLGVSRGIEGGWGKKNVHAVVCGDPGCDEQRHGCGWKGTFPEPGSLSSGVTEQVAGGSEAPRVGVGGVWAPGSGSSWARPLPASGYQECQLSCGFAEVSVRTQSLRMTETGLLACLL